VLSGGNIGYYFLLSLLLPFVVVAAVAGTFPEDKDVYSFNN